MRFLITLFSAVLLYPLSAQYTISGTVTDGDGNPLEQASVFVVESQYATITDENGYYELTDLEEAEHTLKASYVGYESFVDYIDLTEDTRVDINLGDNNLYMNIVDISTNRVADDGVFAKTDISKADIEKDNIGQDIPFLLRWNPSVVATSDAGTGIGYTGIRIRGTDASRINITINGVPVNDAESQGVFWVNMPDFASSVDDIQIQRGVGTSTNGAGAFGGTVSLNTDKVHQNNYINFNGTLGSFGTQKASFTMGTGLINNRYTIDGRYSIIKSDGFIDRGSADLKSYYLSVARVTERSSLRFITFSGSEITYQAWYGVPEAKALGDEAGALAHFNWNNGPFSYNLYRTPQDSINYFNSDRSYNYYQYDNQVDDYRQGHYQLHHTLSASDKLTFKTSAFLTQGRGFFEQFRLKDDFSFYSIPPVNLQGDSIATADTLIRRKWLDNTLYGGLFTAKYNLDDGYIQLGGAVSRYDGDHFGRVVFAEGFTRDELNRKYYDNKGVKDDWNAYLKYSQQYGKIGVFADAQIRNVNYSIQGVSDDLVNLDLERNYSFFNPKLGISYIHNSEHNAYLSVAIANREPDRNDIISVKDEPARSEQLTDVELGYRYTGSKWNIEWNNYFMSYKDQLVLTGALDDVGNPTRFNVDNSYRLGTEISATTELYDKVFWNVNTTLSQNRITDFTENIDGILIDHTDTDIAFSPSMIVGNSFLYRPKEGLDVELTTKFVGKQYLDNTSNENRKIDPYSFTNLRVGYDWDIGAIDGIKLTLQVNNLFDTAYSSNGYTYSYDAGDIITENYLYPQAGIHFMLGAQVRL